jgi:hypothetical protein
MAILSIKDGQCPEMQIQPLKRMNATIDLGCRRELFVDDFLIDRTENVRLDLKHPERREAIAFDAPWEGNTAFPCSLIADRGVVRLYYRASIADLKDEEHSVAMALAESRDGGYTFVRPNLGLHEFKGSRDNNILARGLPVVPPAFIDTNPNCRENERYKGFNPTCGHLYAMCSADGIRWRAMQDEPLVYSGAFDTINTGFWDAIAGCYRSYTRAWVNHETKDACHRVRIIQSATSPDFIHWSEPIANVYADGENDVHLYTNATLPCPGAEHLYVAFPCRIMERRRRGVRKSGSTNEPSWATHGCNDALFMASRDGVHWTRYLDAWVRPGPDERNWGQRSNYPAWGIVPTSETEWTMYVSEHYMQPDMPGRFRRLSIRPHGFVSAHADYRGGGFTTRPLVFGGRCLRLNYSTSVAGSIQVELQDAGGKSIPGFRLDDMEPLFGDELDGGVTWKGGSDLAALIGKPVRLRFAMKDADLFALRFSSQELGVSRCEVVPLPPFTYRTKATCSEVRVRPAPGPVAIDGDLKEWDLSRALPINPPDSFTDRCNALIALMYDAEALYVAGDIADPFPMINALAFDGDMRKSWDADAVQIHLRVIADGTNADINDIRLWYSTKDRRAGCCVILGINEKKARLNPPGVQGAYRLRADGKGYSFEYRIPWAALNSARAPRRGEKLTACIQCHWGTENGDGLLCGAVDVRADSSKEAFEPPSWGRAVFE